MSRQKTDRIGLKCISFSKELKPWITGERLKSAPPQKTFHSITLPSLWLWHPLTCLWYLYLIAGDCNLGHQQPGQPLTNLSKSCWKCKQHYSVPALCLWGTGSYWARKRQEWEKFSSVWELIAQAEPPWGHGDLGHSLLPPQGSQGLHLLQENPYNLNKWVCIRHLPQGHLSFKY